MKYPILGLITALSSLSVSATAVSEIPDTTNLSEVRVTAIKQSSSLLRQPVTVTTVRQPEIERLNVAGMKGLSEIAPNFYMPDYGSRMTASIYVRGIGARIDQPAVGLNVDNIPYLNKNSFDFDMADVARVEVLRGPQSTLYGRNTIAGLINVYTINPMTNQGVRISGTATTNGSYKSSIGIYHKLHPRLGMSITAYNAGDAGYFRNKYNGKKADRAYDESYRWRTIWRPSSVVNIENNFSFTHSRQHGYPYKFEDTGEINYNDECGYRRDGFTDGITVSWATPWFTLASITGLHYLSDRMTLDQDFLPLSYFTLTQRQHERSVTQDIVLRGSKGSYSWLAGVFGFYKHNRMHAPVHFKKDGIDNLINSQLPSGMSLSFPDDSFLLDSHFRQPVRGFAAYHRSSLDLGKWTFSAGIRFDYEHANLSYASDVSTIATMNRGSIALGHKAIEIHDKGRLGQTFSELLPNISVTYNMRNSAVFLSAAKGYKAGGYNTQMFSDILQSKMMASMGQTPEYDIDAIVSYRPEVSWNYELGGHFSCDEGRVYSTFSAFWIDVRDQQVTIFPEGTTTGRMMANAGRTRSLGAELTIRYTPAERWKFDLSYGYTHATFRNFHDGLSDLSGNRVPYAPSNTLFLSAAYHLPIRSEWIHAISFCPTLRGTGSIYWDEENEYRQPFYAEMGASVRFEHKNWSIDLWGKNLTDTRFDIFHYESIGNNFFQQGKPVRGGITLRINVGENMH